MALDHGLLNLPLAKRGNFDKELNDHLASEKSVKADQLFQRKTAFNDAHSRAKYLYLLLDNVLVRAEAERRGLKLSEFREVLKTVRDSKPKLAAVAFEPFIKCSGKECRHCGRIYDEPVKDHACSSDDCPGHNPPR